MIPFTSVSTEIEMAVILDSVNVAASADPLGMVERQHHWRSEFSDLADKLEIVSPYGKPKAVERILGKLRVYVDYVAIYFSTPNRPKPVRFKSRGYENLRPNNFNKCPFYRAKRELTVFFY